MANYNTLQECIEQLEMYNYECEGGYLVNNIAFVRLKELAQVNNLNLPVVSVTCECSEKAINHIGPFYKECGKCGKQILWALTHNEWQ